MNHIDAALLVAKVVTVLPFLFALSHRERKVGSTGSSLRTTGSTDKSSHHFLVAKPALVVFPSLVFRGPMFLLQDLPRIYNGQEKARGLNQLLKELHGW